MARLPRLCIPDQAHLLIQKARDDQPVLADDADRDACWAGLREAACALRVAVHAFAVTPSQVRLLVTPPSSAALSLMLQAAGRRFVAAYNRRHGRHGPLWNGRFNATVIDAERYFVECLRFVEAAPVQLRLAERAEQWPWSSAAHHSGRVAVAGLTEHAGYWALGNTPFEREAHYRQLLELPLSEARLAAIERAALRGWALGAPGFLEAMGRVANRRISPLAPGRRKSG
ncbi:MAG: transposase [Burkholderiaceae bacterium]